MRALIYAQSRDERSQIRPFVAQLTPNVVMVNSAEELLVNLRSDKPFDLIVLDDSFDAKSIDGEELSHAPSIAEIMQEIQAGYTASSDATMLCLLRSCCLHEDAGTISVFVDTTQQDRQQLYTELGASLFLAKPYTIETLKKRLAEAAEVAAKPPAWIRALKQVRALYLAKHYAEVIALLDKLAVAGLEDQHLAFALLRARCLTQMGDEHLPASIEVLRKVLLKYPQSLSIRMLLIESHMRLNQLNEAFAQQLSIFSTQKTAYNFDRTLQSMLDVYQRTIELNADRQSSEETLLNFGRQILDVLLRDAPPYSRKLRPQLFQLIGANISETKSLTLFIQMLKESEDVIEAIAPILKTSLEQLCKKLGPDDVEIRRIFEEGHILLLASFPAEPTSIEIATKCLLEMGRLEDLDRLLKKAEVAGAKSMEFYVSLSRYFLKIENLKEASDVLHKAVRLKADDPRVVELRARWQLDFNAKNKAPG